MIFPYSTYHLTLMFVFICWIRERMIVYLSHILQSRINKDAKLNLCRLYISVNDIYSQPCGLHVVMVFCTFFRPLIYDRHACFLVMKASRIGIYSMPCLPSETLHHICCWSVDHTVRIFIIYYFCSHLLRSVGRNSFMLNWENKKKSMQWATQQ